MAESFLLAILFFCVPEFVVIFAVRNRWTLCGKFGQIYIFAHSLIISGNA